MKSNHFLFFSAVLLIILVTVPSSPIIFVPERSFWVLDTYKAYNGIDDDGDGLIDFSAEDWNEGIYQITATLINESDHFKTYVDNSLSITHDTISISVEEIEDRVSLLTQNFGELPDINSDEHITIIITDLRDGSYYGVSNEYVQGFFWPVQSKPYSTSGIQTYSHYEEILFIDSNAVSGGGMPNILSHELQHIIQYSKHNNQELWLDEGLSVYSQYLCGYDSDPDLYVQYLLNTADITEMSLTYFVSELESYGYSYLFIRYINELYGVNVVKRIVDESTVGMNAVLNAVKREFGRQISSAELITNFSMALIVNTHQINSMKIPDYSSRVPSESAMIEVDIENEIRGWGFRPYQFQHQITSGVKFVFEGDRLDSDNNAVTYWLTLLAKNETSYQMWSYMIDPLTGKAEGLWPIDKVVNSTVYLVVNAFSGISSGVNPGYPPESSFKLTTHSHSSSFFFPGYLHIDNQNIMNVGIRVYNDSQMEWSDKNTLIAKYQVLNSKIDEVLVEGNLLYTPSGWIVPNEDLSEFRSITSFKIKYLFYNGEETINFDSDSFTIRSGGGISIPKELFEVVLPVGGTLAILGAAIILINKNKHETIDSDKLTKLEPMYYRRETKNKKRIKIQNRKVKFE